MKQTNKINFKQTVKEIKVAEGEQSKVLITETYEKPRYEGRIMADMDGFYSDSIIEGIKADCKIWVGTRDYSNLTNYEIDKEELDGTLVEDLETFQRMLDKDFGKGKYEAFVLGAYIHGATSFSVNKSGNHTCPWDSGQLGFIGLPTSSDQHNYTPDRANQVAKDLTTAWNGETCEYQVIDNLTGDIIESDVASEWSDVKDFAERMKEKYGIDFFNMEVTY